MNFNNLAKKLASSKFLIYFLRCSMCTALFNKFLRTFLLLYKIYLSHFILSLPFIYHFPICTVYVHTRMCVSIVHYVLYMIVDSHKLLYSKFPSPPPPPPIPMHISRGSGARRIPGIGVAYICDSLHYTLRSHACMHACCMHACMYV